MPRKPLKFAILSFAVLGVLASACTGPQVREPDPLVQSLQSENQSLQKTLGTERKKTKELQTQLQAERKKVEELTAQLALVRPPLDGETLPVDELVAVPEKYVEKEIVVEGKLGTLPFFRGPGGHFILRSLESRASIQCYFERKKLDPASRRLLVATKPLDKLRVFGRLVRESNGIADQVGIRAKSGFEFHVTKIES